MRFSQVSGEPLLFKGGDFALTDVQNARIFTDLNQWNPWLFSPVELFLFVNLRGPLLLPNSALSSPGRETNSPSLFVTSTLGAPEGIAAAIHRSLFPIKRPSISNSAAEFRHTRHRLQAKSQNRDLLRQSLKMLRAASRWRLFQAP